ncbi:putative GCIP-interacting protein [Cryptosporidium canis]|uniref:Pre-mRNA-splicing factor SYF2 n=1 Tax=Cryptosporidium canis TaxID=195482 RepID=A0A9D5DH26_9CRYT|nr:putative GCIP-interacting protein [Cryptosporidium canis]
MSVEKKVSNLSIPLGFLFQNESGAHDQVKKEMLQNLNLRIQSAMVYNMGLFRNERKKELDKVHKYLNEEYIESSALRVSKNAPKIEYSYNSRFDTTELWKVQKHLHNSEGKSSSNLTMTKSKNREGLISRTSKIIRFDEKTYKQQMNKLSSCPEMFESLRTSHIPTEDDKNMLINLYLKNHRIKSVSESLDISHDVYYINQGNKRYNEKLDRAFSEYSMEIKQNLERGTAL